MVSEPSTTLDPQEWANMIVLQESWITFGRNCDAAVHTLLGSVVKLKQDDYHASHSIRFLYMMNVLSIV